jgi:hypothetical protein
MSEYLFQLIPKDWRSDDAYNLSNALIDLFKRSGPLRCLGLTVLHRAITSIPRTFYLTLIM